MKLPPDANLWYVDVDDDWLFEDAAPNRPYLRFDCEQVDLFAEHVRQLRDHLTAMLAKLDNRCESCGALAGEMQQCRECGPILGHDDGVSLPEPSE